RPLPCIRPRCRSDRNGHLWPHSSTRDDARRRQPHPAAEHDSPGPDVTLGERVATSSLASEPSIDVSDAQQLFNAVAALCGAFVDPILAEQRLESPSDQSLCCEGPADLSSDGVLPVCGLTKCNPLQAGHCCSTYLADGLGSSTVP